MNMIEMYFEAGVHEWNGILSCHLARRYREVVGRCLNKDRMNAF